MSPARVDTLIWLLIYGGMVLIAIGVAAGREDAGLGWSLGAAGAAGMVAGLVMIFVRSRAKRTSP